MSDPTTPGDSVQERYEEGPPPLPGTPRGRRSRREGGPRPTVGGAISNAFSAWMQNFIAFTLLAVLVNAPFLAFGAWYLSGSRTLEELRGFAVAETLVPIVFTQILSAGVVFGVVSRLRGVHEGVGRSFLQGLRRVGPAVLVALVISPPQILQQYIWIFHPEAAAGTLLLTLVSVIVSVLFFVAVPAAVVERPRALGLAALGRSAKLTQGRRGTVFAILLLSGLIIVGLSIGLGFLAYALFGEEVLEIEDHSPELFLFTGGVSALFQPFLASISAVTYFLLRREKEGYDVEDVAEIF